MLYEIAIRIVVGFGMMVAGSVLATRDFRRRSERDKLILYMAGAVILIAGLFIFLMPLRLYFPHLSRWHF